MKTASFLFLLALCSISCHSLPQPSHNLDFDSSDDQLFPRGWIKWGMNDFVVRLDSTLTHSGKFAARINPSPDATPQSFGSVAYRLDAGYEGKNVTLEGFMKIEEVQDGFAGLLMRIDGDGRTLQFDNMQRQQIQGSHDWKKYTITLPLPEEAQSIYVAGILAGKGKAWFDSFQVFVDGNRIEDAKRVATPLAKAELDKEFDSGSKVNIDQPTAFQEQSLYKLGKIWGFVKAYHPTVRKGDVNWDYELFRILPGVLNGRTHRDVNKEIAQWIVKLGALDKAATAPDVKPENVKILTPLEWIGNEADLGKELSELLVRVKHQKRGPQNYYVGQMPGVGNPRFKHENPYPAMSFTDDGLKLLSLFRYWNMIEYYFPYKHLTDEKWDHVLQTFIPKILAAKSELQYKLTLLELIGKVQDTHANIWQMDEALDAFWGKNIAPFNLTYVENQVVINHFLNNDFDGQSDVRVGAVITHVNEMPVTELIKNKIKYCPASNLPTQHRDVMSKLLRSNDEALDITFKTGSGTFKKRVSLHPVRSLNFRESVPSHKLLNGDIGYIYPASLKRGEITAIMEKFANTKGLVVDLRCYPSDFIVFSMNEFLMPEPTAFARFSINTMEEPGVFLMTEPLKAGKENGAHYKGKVVIIINETTQSQAEYTTMALRASPNAVVIGSTTAGADGNVSEIYLPGNVRTMISGIGVYYPDGKETQRIGIVPDTRMEPTIAGIQAGRDELLEKAIELVNH